MMRLPRKNIIMELRNAHDGVVHLLLHLGNKAALPVDFVHRYCVEASSERFLRLLSRCMGRGFYHFRMQVARFEESADGVFAWRVEDTFLELHKLGFLLYDDNRGDWTPYGIYQHLLYWYKKSPAEAGFLFLEKLVLSLAEALENEGENGFNRECLLICILLVSSLHWVDTALLRTGLR